MSELKQEHFCGFFCHWWSWWRLSGQDCLLTAGGLWVWFPAGGFVDEGAGLVWWFRNLNSFTTCENFAHLHIFLSSMTSQRCDWSVVMMLQEHKIKDISLFVREINGSGDDDIVVVAESQQPSSVCLFWSVSGCKSGLTKLFCVRQWPSD